MRERATLGFCDYVVAAQDGEPCACSEHTSVLSMCMWSLRTNVISHRLHVETDMRRNGDHAVQKPTDRHGAIET